MSELSSTTSATEKENAAEEVRKNDDDDDDNDLNSTHNFPQRLMEILSDDRNSDAITWLPHGKAFIITSRKIFAEKVMPKYFSRKSKYSSFTRKLNRWNFVRISSGPELGAYYHEFFLRDKPYLAARMFCKNGAKFAAASGNGTDDDCTPQAHESGGIAVPPGPATQMPQLESAASPASSAPGGGANQNAMLPLLMNNPAMIAIQQKLIEEQLAAKLQAWKQITLYRQLQQQQQQQQQQQLQQEEITSKMLQAALAARICAANNDGDNNTPASLQSASGIVPQHLLDTIAVRQAQARLMALQMHDVGGMGGPSHVGSGSDDGSSDSKEDRGRNNRMLTGRQGTSKRTNPRASAA